MTSGSSRSASSRAFALRSFGDFVFVCREDFQAALSHGSYEGFYQASRPCRGSRAGRPVAPGGRGRTFGARRGRPAALPGARRTRRACEVTKGQSRSRKIHTTDSPSGVPLVFRITPGTWTRTSNRNAARCRPHSSRRARRGAARPARPTCLRCPDAFHDLGEFLLVVLARGPEGQLVGADGFFRSGDRRGHFGPSPSREASEAGAPRTPRPFVETDGDRAVLGEDLRPAFAGAAHRSPQPAELRVTANAAFTRARARFQMKSSAVRYRHGRRSGCSTRFSTSRRRGPSERRSPPHCRMRCTGHRASRYKTSVEGRRVLRFRSACECGPVLVDSPAVNERVGGSSSTETKKPFCPIRPGSSSIRSQASGSARRRPAVSTIHSSSVGVAPSGCVRRSRRYDRGCRRGRRGSTARTINSGRQETVTSIAARARRECSGCPNSGGEFLGGTTCWGTVPPDSPSVLRSWSGSSDPVYFKADLRGPSPQRRLASPS